MNIDRFIQEHDRDWQRLSDLTAQVRRRPKSMTRDERNEFLSLYQLASAHLSQLRSGHASPEVDARLTRIIANAHGVLYGQQRGSLKAFFLFFTETFPGAVWNARKFILISAAVFLLPAFAMGVWIGTSETAQNSIPPALAEAYVNEDFESYYSSEAAAEFASTVFINNIYVSFLAFASGIFLCVGTLWVLVQNGFLIGQAAGLFAASGELPKFFGLILPHGMLELSAIIIAGASGLVLGWTVIAPGDRTRADALAEEGRRAVVIVIGLVLVFLAAALIEGFVTGAPISTYLRVGIGVASWVAFVLYVVVFGRRAEAAGKSGMWGESRPSWKDEPTVRLKANATVR